MTTEIGEALLLQDGEANLYLLPRTVLDQHRVPEERWAEIEQAVGADEIMAFGMPRRTYRLLGVIVAAGFMAQSASAWQPATVHASGPQTLSYAPAHTVDAGPPSTVRVNAPVLSMGSQGPAVESLQRLLVGWGEPLPHGVDSQFGPETDFAVRSFQVRLGLDLDGVVGPQTWGNLLCGTTMEGVCQPEKLGTMGLVTTELQRLLNAHGFAVAVDAGFGPQTDAAVRAYQQSHGLVADGIVGPLTWASLLGDG